jgi:hypothetical protein
MIEQNIQIHNIQTFPDSSDQRVGESTRLSNMCAPPLSHPVCTTCRQAQFPYTIHRNVVASRGNRVLTILHVWHGFWQLLHRFFLSIYMIEISLDQRCQFTHSHHIKKKKIANVSLIEQTFNLKSPVCSENEAHKDGFVDTKINDVCRH